MSATLSAAEPDLVARVLRLLAEAPSPVVDGGIPFRAAQFDAGLAWVRFPAGDGGLGLSPGDQPVVDGLLRDAGVKARAPAQPHRLRQRRSRAGDAWH
jgi:hypothetical protein